MLHPILAEIGASGPMLFSAYVSHALYDPNAGFYCAGGGAGRRGDFVTSPEVGPLFGACIARALDKVWHELGRPDPFTLVDCGAGPGTMSRAILAAEPECGSALVIVAVEISEGQRDRHPAEVVSQSTMPTASIIGVVFANELLDNLPFDIVERTADGWRQVRVGASDGRLAWVPGEPVEDDHLPNEAELGCRLPLIGGARTWLRQALGLVERGRVMVFDYGASSSVLAGRGDWLRTYRGHDRAVDPLIAPGSRDITTDVPFDQLAAVAAPTSTCTQADFLRSAGGIDALVAEGKAIWAERAHLGDLAAIRARSRVAEAEALLDPAGLGGFTVAEWSVG